MSPTIRPVLDMTDVTSGLKSTFAEKQTLDLTATTVKASNIVSSASNNQNGVSGTSQTSNSTDNSSIVINNTYNVRNDSDIRKISQDLRTTINRYNSAKGVLV